MNETAVFCDDEGSTSPPPHGAPALLSAPLSVSPAAAASGAPADASSETSSSGV